MRVFTVGVGKIVVDILSSVCYAESAEGESPRRSTRGERLDLLQKGGDNMEILEILGLLNLLAVVVFGVINVTKKK